MDFSLLEKVNSPSDLKQLDQSVLKEYALQLRAYITQNILKNGGHLASSLGAVDLTIALNYVFDAPTDKIIYDVGHQTYAHKIITGRKEEFKTIRQEHGISGFPKKAESIYDAATTGHSSTSLSTALGYSRARDVQSQDHHVVSVIGDGALTGGMAFEALNDIGGTQAKTLVILNDNDMSISQNVGGMSKYFSSLRVSKKYLRFKFNLKRAVSALPFFGDQLIFVLDKARSVFKSIAKTNRMFEQMGFKYYGVYDGNNIDSLINILNQIKTLNKPVLLHLSTQKGCGFVDAEKNPSKYHGVEPFDAKKQNKFSTVVGSTLAELAEKDDKIVAITAAMGDGTGLDAFEKAHKDRYFDVGIAEQHAVTMAGGLALGGLKPYFAVYSTFLQRAYDQVLHDVAIDNLPVTFLIDRAGACVADGVTHQGTFDISYLSAIPSMIILAPRDGNELKQMIEFSQDFNFPLAIRYPKSYDNNFEDAIENDSDYNPLKWQVLTEQKYKTLILAVGNRMIDLALKTNKATVVNARSVKPLDTEFLLDNIKKYDRIITLEDGVKRGGFGQSVMQFIADNNLVNKIKVTNFGFDDSFINHASIDAAFENHGITIDNLQKYIDNKK